MARRLALSICLLIFAASLANAQVKPQRVRVSPGVAERLIVHKVPPSYPSDARKQHIEGEVLLKVSIDKQGSVANVELISRPAALAPGAIAAVKQWKYKPYLLNGNAVIVETQVKINFTLAP